MVERRLVLRAFALLRGLVSLDFFELSLEEALEENGGDADATTGRYCEHFWLRDRKREAHISWKNEAGKDATQGSSKGNKTKLLKLLGCG